MSQIRIKAPMLLAGAIASAFGSCATFSFSRAACLLLLYLTVSLTIWWMVRALAPPVVHRIAWALVLWFLWCASRAWLSYRNGYPPQWLFDDYYWYGLFYPNLCLAFAPTAGYDLGKFTLLVGAGPGTRVQAVSYALRGTLAIAAILFVKMHWIFFALFVFPLAVTIFAPLALRSRVVRAGPPSN